MLKQLKFLDLNSHKISCAEANQLTTGVKLNKPRDNNPLSDSFILFVSSFIFCFVTFVFLWIILIILKIQNFVKNLAEILALRLKFQKPIRQKFPKKFPTHKIGIYFDRSLILIFMIIYDFISMFFFFSLPSNSFVG